MSAIDLLPLVLALPLAGVVILTFFGGRMPGKASAWLATLLVGAAFALSVAIAWEFRSLPVVAPEATAEAGEHAATESAEGASEEHAAVGERVFRQDLWRWIVAGDEAVRLTVATRDLEPVKDVVTADAVKTEWLEFDAVEAVARKANVDPAVARQNLEDIAKRTWDPAAVIGQRVMQSVSADAPLTLDNVPPGPGVDIAVATAPLLRQQRFAVDFALQLDGLSLVMLLIVTGVGFLIHVFSVGYMAGDPDIRRYFAYLNLFIFSMLVLVLGANFLVLFVGWELVGACSYLLIGFWYKDPANASAGRKAFIVNRVGDFAFLLGLMLIWTTFGSLAYAEVFPAAATLLPVNGTLAIAITLLLLIGATGKSAQIPLYVWLPDAMAGPTPVSALIHAATMVTAGVYMIARASALYTQAPAVSTVVAVIGAATALLAACIALVQVDIKRVLAYSTISQLGYMFLAVGAGAYVAAIFHLMTHAIFKALLFLGAGSIMHAMEHGFHAAHEHPEAMDGVPAHQDMRRMGGLLGKIPVTGWTFVIGGLALAGLFPLAGFWSKDEILLDTLRHGGGVWRVLYPVALFTALLTAFYTGRQLLMVLTGSPRSKGAEGAHESPAVMTVPLVILAILTLVGGIPGIPGIGLGAAGESLFAGLLAPVFGAPHAGGGLAIESAVIASLVTLTGLALAWLAYGSRARIDPTQVAGRLSWAYRIAWRKFYVDELYLFLFVRPFRAASGFLWRVVDDDLVDGVINGAGRAVSSLAQASRRWQTGNVRQYGLSMLLGAVVIVVYLFMAMR
jgi:NADH-quinone oxidoreductase subunit L